jgi:hypothetical protein
MPGKRDSERERRNAQVRLLWWSTIRGLSEPEAKAALLQCQADLWEHWEKEHPEDGLPEDQGISPDEYLVTLVARIRTAPPPETRSEA